MDIDVLALLIAIAKKLEITDEEFNSARQEAVKFLGYTAQQAVNELLRKTE